MAKYCLTLSVLKLKRLKRLTQSTQLLLRTFGIEKQLGMVHKKRPPSPTPKSRPNISPSQFDDREILVSPKKGPTKKLVRSLAITTVIPFSSLRKSNRDYWRRKSGKCRDNKSRLPLMPEYMVGKKKSIGCKYRKKGGNPNP